MCVDLASTMSTFVMPGPITVFLPTFPKAAVGGARECCGVEVFRRALLGPGQLPVNSGYGIRPDKDSARTGSDAGGVALQIDQ